MSRRGAGHVVWAVAALAGFMGALGLIGADALWLVPLGGHVVHGHLPGSISYATAPTSGWHDVPAAAELIFWSLFHALGGARGLAAAQAVAAATGFGALAWGLRRETTSGWTLLISSLVLVGSLPAVVVTDLSLFSLALFPILLALLEAETRAPSRRLWLSVPLLAVWGNLHGEVLAGWALLACYLVFGRARRQPGLSLAVLAAATVGLAANPALWHTASYYSSVLSTVVAKQGSGLWAPLGTGTLDLIAVAVGAVLLVLSCVGGIRLHLWEGVALAGLGLETVHVARTATLFLLLAAYPAARSPRLGELRPRLLAVAAIALGAGAVAALVKGPSDPGSYSLARIAARDGQPVLAEAVLGQQVALAGGHVWVNNPIDAFSKPDQRLYLDWLDGKPSGAAAVTHAAYVLVRPGSAAGHVAAHDTRLLLVTTTPRAVLYRVRAATARRSG